MLYREALSRGLSRSLIVKVRWMVVSGILGRARPTIYICEGRYLV